MGSETSHVIFGFRTNAIQEFLIARIHAAGKHEVLPHEYSQFVADVVELIGLVDAATPNAQHVHVRVSSRFQQPAILLFAYSSGKAISRYPVCTFCENGDTINDERETLSPRIVFLVHFQ